MFDVEKTMSTNCRRQNNNFYKQLMLKKQCQQLFDVEKMISTNFRPRKNNVNTLSTPKQQFSQIVDVKKNFYQIVDAERL